MRNISLSLSVSISSIAAQASVLKTVAQNKKSRVNTKNNKISTVIGIQCMFDINEYLQCR